MRSAGREHAIASNEGDIEPLTRSELDELCERINIEESELAPKPWFGWVATYGDFGLQVEFFDTREPFDEAIAKAAREHDEGDLDTYTYGDTP